MLFRPYQGEETMLRVDEHGRLMRSPAIEQLIAAARRVVHTWEASPMALPPAERELRHAIELVDAEAKGARAQVRPGPLSIRAPACHARSHAEGRRQRLDRRGRDQSSRESRRRAEGRAPGGATANDAVPLGSLR